MTENERNLGSDLAKVDAHQLTSEEYDEIPELTDTDLARGQWRIHGRTVSDAKGRVAMVEALAGVDDKTSKRDEDVIELEIDADVLLAFRATGPGWQKRINAALRKAIGL